MKKSIYWISLFVILSLFNLDKLTAQTPYPASTQIKDILGIIHQNGKYRFTTSDYLTEGADEIQVKA